MPKFLKEGISQAEKDDADAKVRKIVENILENIKSRGDDALLEYSNKFDNWAPDKFQLSRLEIDKCYQIIHMVNASLPYYKNGNCVDEIQEIHDGWVLHLNEKDYIKIDKEHAVDKLHISLIQQFILFFMLLICFYTLVMFISCLMKLFTNTNTYLVGTLCFCEQRVIYIRFMLFISRIFKLILN